MTEQPTFEAPYPGLRPFERSEAPLFYGRGSHIAAMLKILRKQHFLAVVGSSGCGKSSLVRAGLLPALGDGFLGGPDYSWRFVVTRPGDCPQRRLAETLVAALAESGEPNPETVSLRHATLRTGPGGLLQAIDDSQLPEQTRMLVLVDQFEEIFRFRAREVRHDDEDTRSDDLRNEAVAFVNQLLWTANARDPRVFVALTMRSDFLGDCDAFLDLPEAINRAQFLPPRLTREELEDAITRPPQSSFFSGGIDADVTARLLNSIGGSQDLLPVLQHALLRMWYLAGSDSDSSITRRVSADRVQITTEHYKVAGGFENALGRHADGVLKSLTEGLEDDERVRRLRIAERMFSALCRVSGEGRMVRRLAKVSEIAAIANADINEVIAVADHFRQTCVHFLVATPDDVLSAESTSTLR